MAPMFGNDEKDRSLAVWVGMRSLLVVGLEISDDRFACDEKCYELTVKLSHSLIYGEHKLLVPPAALCTLFLQLRDLSS